ncbi:DUF4355 domain-containing protein [Streptococcus cuniculipharyngis]|uniref:DUF4355 domain-containing protein n=1 Tax=Streptococcus cuniculipharyngis TaxID=1562651 RepID=A0A5C5SGS4_9STRE|nr:DUF4355 domain-containing protein [Streptococcus cuniculipharyngis]TWS99145.1 DUF4355 domain-containing protein [Streptococcus cuniculipharyngis]
MSEELKTVDVVDAQETVDTQGAAETPTEEKQERTFTRSDLRKMISAERAKWEAEQADALEAAKSEGERLAKLSKDQRAKEEQDKRLAEIVEREQAIAAKELRLETRGILAEEGLPVAFLDIVLADTAEAVKDNIATLRQVFDEEVEKRVTDRLTQKAPRQGNTGTGLTKADIMAVVDDEERQRLIAENMHLFR